MAESKLIKLLNNDPKFFYYNGNPDNNRNGGGLGNFTQKKIKFGGDRPDSGNSGQPYINAVIPERRTPTGTDDGYIRGGAILANRASIIDKERIKKFLKDKPKGTLFVQRQTKLQFSNPKLEVKKYGASGVGGLFGGVLSLAAATFNVVNEFIPGPTRLYNAGFNTLAQVGENAFGQHFDRHGLAPVQDDNSKYLAVVKHNNGNGNNRLVGLKKKLIKEIPPPSNFLNSVNFIVSNINALFKTNISTTNLQAPELTIDNYLGGPGSLYGSGRTIIRRFDITGNDPKGQNKYAPVARFDNAAVARIQTLSNLYNAADPNVITTLDFGALFSGRKTTPPIPQDSPLNQTAVNYNDTGRSSANIPAGANHSSDSPTARKYSVLKNAVNNLQLNKKQITANLSPFINNVKDGRVNGLNTKSPNYRYYGGEFLGNALYVDPKDKTKGLNYTTRNIFDRKDSDILTVSFFAINPFGEVGNSYEFAFSGYMKGFKDNFDATWNEFNYIGRSESFYTYGKFKRNVTFTLDVPCFNREQLLEKHRALGQLAATTAGAYNTNGLLGGVLLKVKVGGYLDNEYAILNNISYDIPDDSSWDVDNADPVNPKNKLQLAMYVKVNVSLTIIHSKENRPPQYTVPRKNSSDTTGDKKSGFFGYLKDPIDG